MRALIKPKLIRISHELEEKLDNFFEEKKDKFGTLSKNQIFNGLIRQGIDIFDSDGNEHFEKVVINTSKCSHIYVRVYEDYFNKVYELSQKTKSSQNTILNLLINLGINHYSDKVIKYSIN